MEAGVLGWAWGEVGVCFANLCVLLTNYALGLVKGFIDCYLRIAVFALDGAVLDASTNRACLPVALDYRLAGTALMLQQ